MAHRIVGALGVAVFLATGLYMACDLPSSTRATTPSATSSGPTTATSYFGSLANLLLGLHLGPPLRRWRAPVQQLGSLLLLLAPPVLILAFVVEPPAPPPSACSR